MSVIVAVIAFLSGVYFYALPTLRYYRREAERQGAERYYLFKLKAVREYYEALHHLSYHEIHARYDVESAYDNIGRVSGRRP